jgi:hypothetical protein
MIRKNVELELQALVLLQYQLGILDKNVNGRQASSASVTDDEIMALVLKRSKDEYDALMRNNNKSNEIEIAKNLLKSDQLIQNLKTELDQQDYINRKIVKEELNTNKNKTSENVSILNNNTSNNSTSKSKERKYSDSKRVYDLPKELQNLKLKTHITEDDDDIVTKTDSNSIVNNLAKNILAVGFSFYKLDKYVGH